MAAVPSTASRLTATLRRLTGALVLAMRAERRARAAYEAEQARRSEVAMAIDDAEIRGERERDDELRAALGPPLPPYRPPWR